MDASHDAAVGVGQVAWVPCFQVGLHQGRVPQHKALGPMGRAVRADLCDLRDTCAVGTDTAMATCMVQQPARTQRMTAHCWMTDMLGQQRGERHARAQQVQGCQRQCCSQALAVWQAHQ